MFFYDVDVVPVVEGSGAVVVEFVVEDCATPVFHCVFDGCDDKDYDQGYRSETRIRCAEKGENLYINSLNVELGGGRVCYYL